MWFHAARHTIRYGPFVIGSRFGSRDGSTSGGTVYQLGAGGEFMPSLPYFTSTEVKINLLPILSHGSKKTSMGVKTKVHESKTITVEVKFTSMEAKKNFSGSKTYFHESKKKTFFCKQKLAFVEEK